MNSIFKYADDELVKAFITKQMTECATIDHYKFVIFVENIYKQKMVAEWCEKLRDQIMINYIFKVKNSVNEYIIQYANGATLVILQASENIKGVKCHGILVDTDIDNDIKDMCVYPALIPYSISPDKFGDYDRTRVLEARIRVDEKFTVIRN